MCETCGPQIQQIKVVASLQDVSVNNGLTLSNGFLQLGGPLVKNTIINGPYSLNFGEDSNRLIQVNSKVSNRILQEFNNGVNVASILIDNSGILITDTTPTPRGLLGAADFKANYVTNSYVQKAYVDITLLSKNVSGSLSSPGAGQNGYSIVWSEVGNQFTLAPASFTTPGTTTQVIYNDAGSLAGDTKFLWDKTGIGQLTVPAIQLGGVAYGAGEAVIFSNGAAANVDIRLAPKSNGNIVLDVQSGGVVQIGANAGSFSVVTLRAKGNDGLINIALEPKGTEGIVFVGNIGEAGGFRYLQARGASADITLQLRPKGAGEISIGDNSVHAVRHTLRAISASAGTSLRLATKTSTFLDVDASGIFIGNNLSPTLYFGTAADAVTSASIGILSSTPNVSMLIYAKGTGRVYMNGWSFIEFPIGNWDMDIATNASVAHGLDATKIKHVEVWVRNTANTERFPIDFVDILTGFVSGSKKVTATHVQMSRAASGIFNSVDFNGTGFSRGVVTVWYEI